MEPCVGSYYEGRRVVSIVSNQVHEDDLEQWLKPRFISQSRCIGFIRGLCRFRFVPTPTITHEFRSRTDIRFANRPGNASNVNSTRGWRSQSTLRGRYSTSRWRAAADLHRPSTWSEDRGRSHDRSRRIARCDVRRRICVPRRS